jgi:hypothetical protein
MFIQLATLAAFAISAFLAVPYLYEHRMDPALFWGSLVLFC